MAFKISWKALSPNERSLFWGEIYITRSLMSLVAEIGNPPQKEQCKFLLKICRQISTSSLGLNNGAWGRERADAMGEGGFEGHKPSPLLGQWSGGWPWGWGCPPLARWQVGSETKRNQFARLDQTYCDEPEWPGVTPDWWVVDFCHWLKVWTFQPYLFGLLITW